MTESQAKHWNWVNARAELLPLIHKYLSAPRWCKFNLPNQVIIKTIMETKTGFDIQKSLTEIFMDELPYIRLYGMTAFNCGYCWKTTCIPMLEELVGLIACKKYKVNPLSRENGIMPKYEDQSFYNASNKAVPGLKDLDYEQIRIKYNRIFHENWKEEFNITD